MKLISLECNKCGAVMQVTEEKDSVICEYCGAKLLLDDEAIHIKYDDMEKVGYDLEKGKLTAQAEAREREFELEKQRVAEFEKQNKKFRKQMVVQKFIGFLKDYWIIILLVIFLIIKIVFK